jgi:dTDP-4-amino-4,6-dideoxygalactose transaminase
MAERLASRAIALPLYSHMEPADVEEISEIVIDIFKEQG